MIKLVKNSTGDEVVIRYDAEKDKFLVESANAPLRDVFETYYIDFALSEFEPYGWHPAPDWKQAFDYLIDFIQKDGDFTITEIAMPEYKVHRPKYKDGKLVKY